MPRKRKYEAYFVYEDDGTARCRINGCCKPTISRTQSVGMTKHLKVHHAEIYAQLHSVPQALDSDSSSAEKSALQSAVQHVDGQVVSVNAVTGSASSCPALNASQLGDQQVDGQVVFADAVGPVGDGIEVESVEGGQHYANDSNDAASDYGAELSDTESDVDQGAESDSSQEYEVEEIVEKRVYVQYLLKWKGYSAVYNSWEDAANLTRCEELLEDFNAPHPPDNTDEPALSSSQHVADDLPDL